MGVLSTGMVQSWLTVATVVLSQLLMLLFIGIIDRLLRRKARGPRGEQSPGTAHLHRPRIGARDVSCR